MKTDQPKPTQFQRDIQAADPVSTVLIAAMKPKPATGEWTQKKVAEFTYALMEGDKCIISGEWDFSTEIEAHNAALAAVERSRSDWCRAAVDAEKQLAAERKDAYAEGYNKAVGQWMRGEQHSDKSYHPDCPCELCRNKLAAERENAEKAAARAELAQIALAVQKEKADNATENCLTLSKLLAKAKDGQA